MTAPLIRITKSSRPFRRRQEGCHSNLRERDTPESHLMAVPASAKLPGKEANPLTG